MFPKPRFSGALELRGEGERGSREGGRRSRGEPPPPVGMKIKAGPGGGGGCALGALCRQNAQCGGGGGGGRTVAPREESSENARAPPPLPRVVLEGEGPQRRSQQRFGRQLEAVAKAVGGGCCRLQMPLSLALAVRKTALGIGWAPWRGGGVSVTNAIEAGACRQGDRGCPVPMHCCPQPPGGTVRQCNRRELSNPPTKKILPKCFPTKILATTIFSCNKNFFQQNIPQQQILPKLFPSNKRFFSKKVSNKKFHQKTFRTQHFSGLHSNLWVETDPPPPPPPPRRRGGRHPVQEHGLELPPHRRALAASLLKEGVEVQHRPGVPPHAHPPRRRGRALRGQGLGDLLLHRLRVDVPHAVATVVLPREALGVPPPVLPDHVADRVRVAGGHRGFQQRPRVGDALQPHVRRQPHRQRGRRVGRGPRGGRGGAVRRRVCGARGIGRPRDGAVDADHEGLGGGRP